jgi:ribosome maturation factor RimP
MDCHHLAMPLELPAEIRSLLESTCHNEQATLIDAVLRGTKERMILELFVDTPEGISLEQCEKINRALLQEAETNEFIDAIRSIEVSSPGTERPLKHWWQYPRNIGRTLDLAIAPDGTIPSGMYILNDADEHGIKCSNLKQTKKSVDENTTFSLPYSEIQKAIVKVSFS